MQVNNRWLTDELYKLGKQQARVVSSGHEDYMDLLHDVLATFQVRINANKLDPKKITKALLFIALKHTWINKYQKENTQRKKLGSIMEHQDFLADLEYSNEIDKKMEAVSTIYSTLAPIEKELFLLRFVNKSNKRLVCTKLKLNSADFNKIEDKIIDNILEYYKKNGTTEKE